MIVVKFGKWNRSTGKHIYRRLYTKSGKWTPFCRKTKRYARIQRKGGVE